MNELAVIPVDVAAKERFINAFDGDETAAALTACITVDQARRWLRDPMVIEALCKRGTLDPRMAEHGASTGDLKRWWTRIIYDRREATKDRLKASELHGKALGAFIERTELTGPGGTALQVANLNVGVEMPLQELEDRVARLRDGVAVVDPEKELLG